MNSNKYKVFESKDNEKTIYYTYIEKKLYVSTTCYICAFCITFGISYILFHLAEWFCFGVNMANIWDILHLALCLLWAWIVKENILTLIHNSYTVQMVYKIERILENRNIGS